MASLQAYQSHGIRYYRIIESFRQDGKPRLRVVAHLGRVEDSQQAVRHYKELANVERAFRSLKSVDLKIRPIHHHLEERVCAHVFLCMLAYYVEWHMRQALAPMLFDNHDPAAGEALRPSIVA